MNRIFTTIAVLALATSLALAQTPTRNPNKAKHSGGNHTKQDNGNKKGSQFAPEFRTAAQEMRAAHLLMSKCVPIFQGHRAFAMDLDRDATKDLIFATKAGHDAPLPQSRRANSGKADPNRERGKVYPPEVIQESLANMTAALEHIEKARASLAGVTGTWGGYLIMSQQALAQCSQEIKTAIAVVQQRSQP